MKILFENKQLNEGPGAGYTVSGTLTNVKVNSIKNIKEVDRTDLVEYEVELDATADFDDVSANSYYYGGTIDSTPVSIIRARVELEDGEVTNEDVKYALEGVKVEAKLGGGWSHSTFDGTIECDYMSFENAPYLTSVLFKLTDERAINYLDKAVQNENTETQFAVMENNWAEEVFSTEEEAISYAKENGYDSVQIIYVTEYFNGDEDTEFGDIVWTNDEMEESLTEIEDSKTLTEEFDEDERIQALAEYLGIDPSEITNIYDYEFETPEGDYLVVDEHEARELAEEDIRNLYDDLGLDSFTSDFKDWIIMNALDNDWFEDAVRESMESYVDDISYEEGRLEEELLDADIITEEDIENGYDEDDARERYVEKLVDEAGDPVEYCGDNFGWDWVSRVAEQNNLLDMDEVVEQCIDMDGVAHSIARYDGEEIELENGLYAYRTN